MEQYRTIPGWEKYAVSANGEVVHKETGAVLTPYDGAVRLAANRWRRTRRKIDGLVREVFPELFASKPAYVSPAVSEMCLSGEIFRPYVESEDYLVSNKGRVFSWKTGRFVGHQGAAANPYVLMTIEGHQLSRVIHIMVDLTFGPDLPCLDGEEWKAVEASPFYYVSNLGRVWSIKQQKVMTPQPNKRGYLRVDIPGVGCMRVHRMVAKAFCPGRTEERNSVNHINEDKQDNRAANLEWCTDVENTEVYMRNHGYWYRTA